MKKYFIFIIKLAIASILFFVIRSKIDWELFRTHLYTKTGLYALCFCSVLIIIQHILAGTKLWLLSKEAHINVTWSESIKSLFVGVFFTQFGFSFASGDVARGVYLYNRYSNLSIVSALIFVDRVTGFIALSILYLLALLGLQQLKIQQGMLGLYSLALLSWSMILGYIVLLLIAKKFGDRLKFIPQRFLQQNMDLFNYHQSLVAVIIISFLVNLINVIIVYVCGNIFGLELGIYDYFIITIPAMLLSMLPVSIAGWGIRESAFITGFALLNYDAYFGLTISIIFGISALLGSLPGILFIGTKPSLAIENV